MRPVGLSTKHIKQRMKYGKKTADSIAAMPEGSEGILRIDKEVFEWRNQ